MYLVSFKKKILYKNHTRSKEFIKWEKKYKKVKEGKSVLQFTYLNIDKTFLKLNLAFT